MTVPENNNAPKLIKSLQINILHQPHWSGWLHWLALNLPLNVIICHHIHDVRADFYHAAAELLQSCLLRLCRFLRCLQLPSRLRQGFLGTSKHLVIGVRRMAKIGFYIWIPYQNIPSTHETNTMDSRSMNVLGIPAQKTNTSEGWSPELWGTNLWQQITPTICDMTIVLAEHLVALPLLLEIRSSLPSQSLSTRSMVSWS